MIDLRKMTKALLFGMLMLCVLAGAVALLVVPEIRRADLECVTLQEEMLEQTNLIKVSLDEMKSLDLQNYQANNKLFRQELLNTLQDNFNETLSIMKASVYHTKETLNTIDHYALLGRESSYQRVFNATLEIEKTMLAFERLLMSVNVWTSSEDEVIKTADNFFEQVDYFKVVYKEWIDEEYKSIGRLTIGIVFALITVVLILALIIWRMVKRYFSFVASSYVALENHQYDFHDLKPIKPIFKEENQMNQLIQRVFDENKFVSDVQEVLLGHFIVDDAVDHLFKVFEERLGVDRVGIAFVDYEHQKIIAEYGASNYDDMYLGPGFEVPFKSTSLTQILRTHQSKITLDLESQLMLKPHSVPLKMLVNEGIRSNIILPMTMGSAVFGMVFLSSKQKGFFTDEHLKIGEKIIYDVKGLLNRAYFTKVILTKMTQSFSTLVDQRDTETGNHIERMTDYAVIVAKGLKRRTIKGYEIDDKFILDIERNASAHDIGKVGIPDEILKKPGRFNAEEWAIMKTHATIGADIFADLREGLMMFDPQFYKMAEDIARFHHEKWDGTGYPYGKKGEEIPLAARIVAVADVFDAVASKRVYKEAFGFEEAVAIIRTSRGNHLDPVLVDVFLEEIENIYSVYESKY